MISGVGTPRLLRGQDVPPSWVLFLETGNVFLPPIISQADVPGPLPTEPASRPSLGLTGRLVSAVPTSAYSEHKLKQAGKSLGSLSTSLSVRELVACEFESTWALVYPSAVSSPWLCMRPGIYEVVPQVTH